MNRRCCPGGRTSSRPGRVWGAAGSVAPGALLAVLPKCPLCLAAWLAAATGAGVSAAQAAWLREAIAVIWIGAVALAAASMVRRAS